MNFNTTIDFLFQTKPNYINLATYHGLILTNKENNTTSKKYLQKILINYKIRIYLTYDPEQKFQNQILSCVGNLFLKEHPFSKHSLDKSVYSSPQFDDSEFSLEKQLSNQGYIETPGQLCVFEISNLNRFISVINGRPNIRINFSKFIPVLLESAQEKIKISENNVDIDTEKMDLDNIFSCSGQNYSIPIQFQKFISDAPFTVLKLKIWEKDYQKTIYCLYEFNYHFKNKNKISKNPEYDLGDYDLNKYLYSSSESSSSDEYLDNNFKYPEHNNFEDYDLRGHIPPFIKKSVCKRLKL